MYTNFKSQYSFSKVIANRSKNYQSRWGVLLPDLLKSLEAGSALGCMHTKAFNL